MAEERTELGTKEKKEPVKPVTGRIKIDLPEGVKPAKHAELTIQARPEAGFRRAGIYFSGKDEVVIPANSLSQAQLDLIKEEAGKKLLVHGLKATAPATETK